MNPQSKVRPAFLISLVAVLALSFALPSLWSAYRSHKADKRAADLIPPHEEVEAAALEYMDKEGCSPDALERDDLLYHQGLLLAVREVYDRADLFFDAIPRRFPDSPYNQKLKAIKPLLVTLQNGGDNPKVLEAKARLAMEALPLATPSNSWNYLVLPMYFSLRSQGYASIHYWWFEQAKDRVTLAALDSPYALWPIHYGLPNRHSPTFYFEDGDVMSPHAQVRMPPIGFTHGLSPVTVLYNLGKAAVPILIDHLDDPRLMNSAYSNVVGEMGFGMGDTSPRPVGEACYQILCAISGIQFDDVQIRKSPGRARSSEDPKPYTDKRVLAYINKWWGECAELEPAEWIRWHLQQTELSIQTQVDYLYQIGKLGFKEEAKQKLLALHDPRNVYDEYYLALKLCQLGDNSFVPLVLDNYKQKNYSKNRDNDLFSGSLRFGEDSALSLLEDYANDAERKDLLEHLHANCNPNDLESERETIEIMLRFGDKSLLERIVQNLKAGKYSHTPLPNWDNSPFRAAASTILNYGDDRQKRVVVKCIQEELRKFSDLRDPELKATSMKDCPDELKILWNVVNSVLLLFMESKQQADTILPFTEFPVVYSRSYSYLKDGVKVAESNQPFQQEDGSEVTEDVVRLCDLAARELTYKHITSVTFSTDDSYEERNRRIEAMRAALADGGP